RRVAFQLTGVTLPFGAEFQPRLKPLNVRPRLPNGRASAVPLAFHDPDGGGTLTLAAPPGPAPASPEQTREVSLGLSRRGADGSWSPVRWTQAELGDEPLRLEGLAAGRYRVYLRFWARTGEEPPHRLPGPDQPVEI